MIEEDDDEHIVDPKFIRMCNELAKKSMEVKEEKRLRKLFAKQLEIEDSASYVVYHGEDERIFTTKEGMIEYMLAIYKIKKFHAR